ncbi:hypothetical protein OG323_28195 [Streptomyces cyaneofuscatus]|uniref:hypothetical protein n=1 Tax=Streptomyces cyaneofuscatus TaxID=66883 RepID=UPI00386FF0D8|nr:hypothetical protein OG323_28195 [Streptomyces cyaneofuscatus]
MESLTGPEQLLRCFDLVEFAWQRDAPVEPWLGLYATVQTPRLEVPLLIGDLAASLGRIGFPLVEVAPDGTGCRRFVRADSRVGVLVDEERRGAAVDGARLVRPRSSRRAVTMVPGGRT